MKLMHRPCNASRLKEDLLRVKYLGKVFLQTSIIIGFPTETENEFQETLDFLKEVDFDDVYVHFYSDMPGTESSKMNGKLDKHTMERRMYRLIDSGIKNQVDATKQEWENIGVKDVVFVPPVKSYVLEELATNENYDEKSYLLANPDVAKAVERGEFESGRVHFELFGKNERRMLCVLDKSRKERY
jgi:tRNA A37 methylthiotransferase MiaB